MKSFFLFILSAISFKTALAQQINSIPAVGGHYALFTFEKNENPENILILYTKLDENCHYIEESNLPVFDMYWLMDHKTYKPTHSLIKSGVRGRLQLLSPSEGGEFSILLNDFKEVQSDIRDARLTVLTDKAQGHCNVRSLFTLGPSDSNVTIQLQSIYSEATKTLMPPFRRLKSVTLNGTNIQTGEKISRTYQAK